MKNLIKKQGDTIRQQSGMTVNEGPAYEYYDELKKISNLYKEYWDAVKDFGRALEKKGQRKLSKQLYMKYRKQVSGFQQWFDKAVDRLM